MSGIVSAVASGAGRRVPALQQYLLTLIIVPLLGLTTMTGITVHDRLQRRADAEAVLAEVHTAVTVEAAREAVAREMVPMMGYALFSQRSVYEAFGLDAAEVARMSSATSRELLQQAQAATDSAVQALQEASQETLQETQTGTYSAQQSQQDQQEGAGSEGGSTARLLTAARRAMAADVTTGFPLYTRLLNDLTQAGAAHLAQAEALGLDHGVLTPLGQLQDVSHTAALADLSTGLYLDSLIDPSVRTDFIQTWGAFQIADTTLRTQTTPTTEAGVATTAEPGTEAGAGAGAAAVVAAWEQIDLSIAVSRSKACLLIGATTTTQPSVSDFTVLATGGIERDRFIHDALTLAVDHVQTATHAQAKTANRQLRQLYLLGAAIIAITLALTWLVRGAIAGPLRHLARQARTIAAGELVDVAAAGPREVRTVAAGLSATVASLRLIRDQAHAIATNDLDREVLARPAPGALGEYMHASMQQMLCVLRQNRQFQAVLAHDASHDSLTQLPNRAQILSLLTQALHRSARTGTQVAVLFIDLDHFKAVNDSYGHAAGDEVLRVVAARMQDTVRAGDVVARLGGDEFVVLIEGVAGVEEEKGLVELGRRLVASISQPIPLTDPGTDPGTDSGARLGIPETVYAPDGSGSQTTGQPTDQPVRRAVGQSRNERGRTARVGASIGVAFSNPFSPLGAPDPEKAAADLLHDADTAAYRAKLAGRGAVEVYDDILRAELQERSEKATALKEAIASGGLVLFYQPVLDLNTESSATQPNFWPGDIKGSQVGGRVASVEALVRWPLPGGGLVMPDDFIPLAESSSLVCDLGRWVLREATAQLARWDAENGPYRGVDVAVNISGRHVQHRLLDDITDALAESGVAAQRLIVEITETVLLDQRQAAGYLQAVRELGVRVAIDDFGTGYTSIGVFSALPADILKIDRSLVSTADPRSVELVRLLIHAAHSYGLQVVAEGVEDSCHLQMLTAAGCDAVQGYFIARPTPAGQLAADALLRMVSPSDTHGG